MVTGTGPLGCVPAERAMRGRNGQCAADLQRAADLYNPQLVQLVKDLNSQYGSEIFVAVNTGKMQYNFISNPRAFGMLTNPFFMYGLFKEKIIGDSCCSNKSIIFTLVLTLFVRILRGFKI